jgi:gliding motility-associated-like protein
VNEPTILSANITSADVLCNGGNDGMASISVGGGTLPYTYLWSSGQNVALASGLSSGNYNVIVTDNNGCTVAQAVSITQPTALAISNSNLNVSCNGGNNGSSSAIISGGTPSYSYQWSNGQTNSTAGNLSAGIYSLLVTDSNGCSLFDAVTITEPTALAITASSNGASCNGGTDGTATVISSGGTLPYAFAWNNGASSNSIAGLSAGNYSVMITDGNGCIQSTNVSVSEQSPVQLSFSSTNALCNGDVNGSIDLNANGGVSPYNFVWSNGETTQNISNLSAGEYIITVLDGNKCSKTDTILITEPKTLNAGITGYVYSTGYNISSFSGNDGSITLDIVGGTNPYQFVWSNGSTVQDPENLSAGNYSVIVTDANGCTYKASVELIEPNHLEMPTGISPNSDGKNDFFVVHGLDVYPDNKIEIFNRWGDVVYKREGYANDWYGQNQSGNRLPDGTYFVILKVNTGETEKVLTGYVDVRK